VKLSSPVCQDAGCQEIRDLGIAGWREKRASIEGVLHEAGLKNLGEGFGRGVNGQVGVQSIDLEFGIGDAEEGLDLLVEFIADAKILPLSSRLLLCLDFLSLSSTA